MSEKQDIINQFMAWKPIDPQVEASFVKPTIQECLTGINEDAERAAFEDFVTDFESAHDRKPKPFDAWLERARRG